MGRAPCCDKANVKRGPWSPEEDAALRSYLEAHGTAGNWIALPKKAGLRRCGKSCRLRWLNYLRPDIKHGGFTEEEDNVIIGLYGEIGSRWSVIASQLPGRTDNDVKNYWNTKLKKKFLSGKINFPTPNNNTGASNDTCSNSSLGTNNNNFGPEIQHYYNYQALSNTSEAGVDPTMYSTLFTNCHYMPCLNWQVPSPKIESFVDLRDNVISSMTQTFSMECLSSVNSSGNSSNSLGTPTMDNENRIMSSSFATNGRLDGGPSFGFGFTWDMLINELLFDEKLGGEIRPGGVLAEVNPHIPHQSPINFQY